MRSKDERGVILVVVLVFALLLVTSITTFQRRAMLDSMVARHRDSAAEAEAAARGGVRLAITLLLEDRLQEITGGLDSDSLTDAWARASGIELPAGDGVVLRLSVEDAGARLNLNALIDGGKPRKYSELFLTQLLERVIDDIPTGKSKAYDTADLAQNLLDYLDADEVAIQGGLEDDAYQRRDPPAKAPNRPLLSVDELRLVEGFDGPLVDALRPYVTVYPYARADGINPNTAPPYVLGLVFHGVGEDFRFASEDEVKSVLKAREGGELVCADDASNPACAVKLQDVLPGEVFPPPTFTSRVFTIRAEATVGEVRRTIEAVVDRGTPSQPQILAWRVR
jgi:type II secretory pathway component PulK